jgi:hypothetical protein
MTFLSDNTHYLDVFFFEKQSVQSHTMHQYPEKEAGQMFQRAVNKYKVTNVRILIALRDQDHQLIKSELLNY